MACKKVEVKSVEVVNEYTCDRCGKKASGRITCLACGRDLCEKCVTWDTSEYGDYLPEYCRPCWDLGTKYRETVLTCEELEEDAEAKWKAECVAARERGE